MLVYGRVVPIFHKRHWFKTHISLQEVYLKVTSVTKVFFAYYTVYFIGLGRESRIRSFFINEFDLLLLYVFFKFVIVCIFNPRINKVIIIIIIVVIIIIIIIIITTFCGQFTLEATGYFQRLRA